ncbi:MAG: ATP-binding protein [Burkholderiales bacterium]
MAPPGARERARPTLLLVDDTPEHLTILGEVLAPIYNVRIASHGAAALEIARRTPPDLVLLDVLMPGMSGYETLAALRSDPRTADIPVIFVTSLDATEDEQRGFTLGAADYIVKPVRAPIVLARVALHLELKRARDGLARKNASLAAEIERRSAAEVTVRELNSALSARSEALERSVADLEAFAYSISHDLRAPLRAISGFADLLRESDGERLSEEGRGMLGRIAAAALRMSGMIDDVLAYSRTQSATLHVAPVDLRALAAEVAAELGASYPDATVDIGALPRLKVDAPMMRQILANLVGNALKFSAKASEPRVRIESAITDAGVEIQVTDNGAGFDPRYADRLFGLFQRLHSQKDFAGSGVGLAIVKRLVERHGGRITAHSKPGVSTTFQLTFPAASLA